MLRDMAAQGETIDWWARGARRDRRAQATNEPVVADGAGTTLDD